MAAPDSPVILVVDDDETFLRMIRLVLKPLGRIVTAPRADEALASARAERPDVVITDLMMPHTSGVTFARQLKADPGLSSVPIIFLSASTSADDVADALSTGPVAFMNKPFRSNDLYDRLARMLGQPTKSGEP